MVYVLKNITAKNWFKTPKRAFDPTEASISVLSDRISFEVAFSDRIWSILCIFLLFEGWKIYPLRDYKCFWILFD